MLAADVRLCDGAMRLIGRPLLLRLAEDAGDRLRGYVRAFAAEIGSASWKSARSLQRTYPNARIEKRRAVVDLDEEHCVAIIVDYERSVVVVQYAGASAKFKKMSSAAETSRRCK